jgi:hypothetical protein
MTTRLQKLLFGLGATALISLLVDRLWPTPLPPKIVQPAQSNARIAPDVVSTLSPQRPTFIENGEDLFVAQVLKQQTKAITLPQATVKPVSRPSPTPSTTQSTVQIRAIDSQSAQPTPSNASAIAVPETVVPSPPSPPSLTYSAFGQYVNADRTYLLLTKDGKTVVAQLGDVLDGTWKLTAISRTLATWQHLSTTQILNIPVPSLP